MKVSSLCAFIVSRKQQNLLFLQLFSVVHNLQISTNPSITSLYHCARSYLQLTALLCCTELLQKLSFTHTFPLFLALNPTESLVGMNSPNLSARSCTPATMSLKIADWSLSVSCILEFISYNFMRCSVQTRRSAFLLAFSQAPMQLPPSSCSKCLTSRSSTVLAILAGSLRHSYRKLSWRRWSSPRSCSRCTSTSSRVCLCWMSCLKWLLAMGSQRLESAKRETAGVVSLPI